MNAIKKLIFLFLKTFQNLNMNKNFLKSVATGIVGLALVASCSSVSKKDSNTCGAKNGCAAKKDEASKCSAKKEVNKTDVKKSETKKSKKAKKVVTTEAKKETTTEKAK